MKLSSLVSVQAAVLLKAVLAAAQGTFDEVDGDAGFFTFDYSTDEPDSTNWVGLYNADGGGPVDEEFVEESLVWEYAPDAEGTVKLSTSSLQPGEFTAFYLAKDGYKWLADPVNVTFSAEDIPAEFIATDVTLPNARQGNDYSQRIAGLVKGSEDVTFELIDSPEWLFISEDGVLSGTPGPDASDAQFSVSARDGSAEASADFTIPVRPSGARLIDRLGVLSFNMWMGGTNINDHHAKQVRFLATSGADVVGLQEDQAGASVERLADALGWYSWASGDSMSVLSKYPIAEEHGVINRSGGVRIALDGEEQQVNLYSVHLTAYPYGPYDFCFEGMSVEEVLQRETESGRTPQITETLQALEENGHVEGADEVPLLIVGDFNAPSHLDWIEEFADKNCGVSEMPWPTSKKPEEAGLVDSFREAHPDPVDVPGITWSPLFSHNEDEDKPEPQDRIDFVYYKGKSLRVVGSEAVVVGEPEVDPDYEDNEWTSDHAAVLTTFEWVD